VGNKQQQIPAPAQNIEPLLAIIRPPVLPKLHQENILKNQRRLRERHAMLTGICRRLMQ
jgi:hypothetical protein